jgi:hypothetical protein
MAQMPVLWSALKSLRCSGGCGAIGSPLASTNLALAAEVVLTLFRRRHIHHFISAQVFKNNMHLVSTN